MVYSGQTEVKGKYYRGLKSEVQSQDTGVECSTFLGLSEPDVLCQTVCLMLTTPLLKHLQPVHKKLIPCHQTLKKQCLTHRITERVRLEVNIAFIASQCS